MFDVFGSVMSLLKVDSVCIDNRIFRLHYKCTVVLLLAFSLLVTARQYIGDPIDCIFDASISGETVDTYCWIHSTYTVLDRLDGKIGVDVPHPGVSSLTSKSDQVKYHKYYQWVCFVLFFQAMFCYLPRYLWKTWEGGRMKMLVMDLNCPVLDERVKLMRKRILLGYFIRSMGYHNWYAFRFFLCEILNFVNIVGQIFFVDMFLGYEFSTYGIDVLGITEQDLFNRIDPMTKVFPKVTKCTFKKYGPSGNIVPYDGLCVLPLNIVNEKIYVFLWFWYLIMATISGFALLYRMATVFVPRIRFWLLRTKSGCAEYVIKNICKKCRVGDWFLLCQLSKSVDALIYSELIQELASRLDETETVQVELEERNV